MIRTIFITAFLLFLTGGTSLAQEINFSTYADYNLTVGELDNTDLQFGQIVTGSGTESVDITNGKIIEIKGIEYLDVIVEVEADNFLYLNGVAGGADDNQKIPFTLEAAYANNKGMPTIGRAKFITEITGNTLIKRFPILERQHQPPGPPPTPPTNATDFAELEETAYLYIFGSINVGEVDAGPYIGHITITVSYE